MPSVGQAGQQTSRSGVNCWRLKLLASAQLPSSAGAELLSFAQEGRCLDKIKHDQILVTLGRCVWDLYSSEE